MGLLDTLLAGTRFDQKANLDKRMQNQPGLQQGQPAAPVVPQVQPQAYSNDPEAMIRRLRAQRQAEKQAEAAAYMQAMGGQVLPR